MFDTFLAQMSSLTLSRYARARKLGARGLQADDYVMFTAVVSIPWTN